MDAGVLIRERLGDVWSQAHVVQIVAGGENHGPLARRAVLAEIRSASSVDALRTLVTAGRLTGDICRCHGGPTVVVRDASGQALASASIHGYGSVSWDRSRLRNDLTVADPAGFHLFLAEHGVPHQLAMFEAPLIDRLNLYEGRPQFRPAGKAGLPYLAERGVPDVLHPMLSDVSGRQAGELPDAQVDDARRRLTAAMPSPVDRAMALLSWLGRLSAPCEATWGEGALVRRLLSDLSEADLMDASATASSAHVVMGVVNRDLYSADKGMLALAIGPALRQLFPPDRANEA
ncbi:hypothetical protein DMB66_05435 [Actinoplanes sp. ATCC 53533]|uniref:hypothetical protein n=1 Tax=Actinoplanes sp. ATCC 53533 TaxID=1288362 RepID=UPI000F76A6A3|nr:hypothetical protein [Actinoplanes sp. ATCC 53533]RSM72581.1 hypothetical protein DMB66_05435 [Actinoplanes sp. ATCC 53533]